MVKVGDNIETDDGRKGKVTDIILNPKDGRYVILFRDEDCPHYFKEGDVKFKVKELKEKGMI